MVSRMDATFLLMREIWKRYGNIDIYVTERPETTCGVVETITKVYASLDDGRVIEFKVWGGGPLYKVNARGGSFKICTDPYIAVTEAV